MITKDVLLIVSPGRTGTAFLGRHLGVIVEDCWSAHEPDVWAGWRHPGSWRALRWFGPWHVIAGKLIRRTGIRVAGERYAFGEWDADRTIRAILRQRKRFIESRPASLVAESNYQWHFVLPLLPRIFESYRVLALVRDAREWIRSTINHGTRHGFRDRVERLGLRPSAPTITERAWAELDDFQRLCHDWTYMVRSVRDAAGRDPRVHLVRYEDVFGGSQPESALEGALAAVLDFGHRRYGVDVPSRLLERRANASAPGRTRGWEEWSDERREYLLETCGRAMEDLGYSIPDSA